MLNLFQIPITDQSVQYLGQMFGNVGFALQGSGSALLGSMFKVFNTSLLVLGTIIVGYGTVIGVVKTASEGEFMGKHGSMWTPVRMVLGIAALVPTNTGYCAIQTIVMWMIMQGIGMADSFWNVAVNYFAAGGTLYTPAASSSSLQDATGSLPNTLSTIMQGLVCQAAVVKANDPTGALNATTAPPATSVSACQTSAATASCPNGNSAQLVYNFGRTISGDPQAACECGQVQLCGDGSPNTNNVNPAPSVVAQQQALQTILSGLEPASNIFAAQVINDPSCWDSYVANGAYYHSASGPDKNGNTLNPAAVSCTLTNSCIYAGKYMQFDFANCAALQANLPNTLQALYNVAGANFIGDAINLFHGYANTYVAQQAALAQGGTQAGSSSLAALTSSGYTPPSATVTSQAQSTGWIFAGAYYYFIALQQNPLANNYNNFIEGVLATQPNFTCAPNATTPGDICNNTLVAFPQNSATAIGTFVKNLVSQASAAVGTNSLTLQSGGGIPMPSVGWDPLTPVAIAVANDFISVISNPGGDPIVAIHSFGHNCLIAASALFVGFMILSVVLGITGTVVIVLGFSPNPFENLSKVLEYTLMPLVYFFMGYLIVVGAFLGVYLPMIPFTIFTVSAIGWFMLVMEAMFASSLVAIGMLAGGQQNEILGRAEPAMMILLNIILRPSLMVGGMFAAMILAYVSVEFINVGFSIAITNLTTNNIGTVEVFCWLIFYIYLVITILNKCYTLIYVLPDKVLAWVGGHPAGGGEAEALSEVKGGVSGGAGTAKAEGEAGIKAGIKRGGAEKFGKNSAGHSKGEKLSPAQRIRSREGPSGGG